MRTASILTLIVTALTLAACSPESEADIDGTYALTAETTAESTVPIYQPGEDGRGVVQTDVVTVETDGPYVTVTFRDADALLTGFRRGSTVELTAGNAERRIWYELAWSGRDRFDGTLRRTEGEDRIHATLEATRVAADAESAGTASDLFAVPD